MCKWILAAAIVLFSLQVADAASCKAGETVTLEGEIIIPPVMDGGEWFWPGKFAGEPCKVMTLKGKGALPAECLVGKRMTLTGRVIEDGVLILEVTKVSCF